MVKLEANLINIFDNTISYSEITLTNGRIFKIRKLGDLNPNAHYVLPGFVDAHVHIESSMLTPSQFAKMAVSHGTIAAVSDPHEIANVMGKSGVEFMVENGKKVPFKFCFGAPSCVPATTFETAGAALTIADIESLFKDEKVGYLAEMMNFPGVLGNDPEILAKLDLAKVFNKPVDGHAPGLMGDNAKRYFSNGISTDHECSTLEEAKDKLELGVKILIREGSAAKNFDALIPLAHEYEHLMMFCSDDKHPDDLENGHINLLIKRALEAGINLFSVLRMASLNPVRHYNLPMGLLREGESADFIEINNIEEFKILKTYIDGELVAEKGKSLIENVGSEIVNNFNTTTISEKDIIVDFPTNHRVLNVIKVNDGQIVTERMEHNLVGENIKTDLLKNDILKLVVYNRYKPSQPPAVAYIYGFGLKEGAIASSVAHDSHNIIAVGTEDEFIVDAINLIVREKGGISAVSKTKMGILKLPIAGLMSDKDGYEVSKDYTQIDGFAKKTLGSILTSPFMSLSFMALLVIPNLKLSDKGLFDAQPFDFKALTC
jgi:adenine deaminase